VLADRDNSHLRLVFLMPNGQTTNVDIYGVLITELQRAVNEVVQQVPGLALWKGEDYRGPTPHDHAVTVSPTTISSP